MCRALYRCVHAPPFMSCCTPLSPLLYSTRISSSKCAQDFQAVRKNGRFYERLLQNLEWSGFVSPTPVQRQVVPVLLQGREVLAVAPTGQSLKGPLPSTQALLDL